MVDAVSLTLFFQLGGMPALAEKIRTISARPFHIGFEKLYETVIDSSVSLKNQFDPSNILPERFFDLLDVIPSKFNALISKFETS